MQLIKRAQQGDAEAFVQLIKAHELAMYKVAKGFFRDDADVADAMQETTLHCYEKLWQLKNPQYFKTWLLRIHINTCNTMKRKGGKYAWVSPPEGSDPGQGQANVEFSMMMDAFPEPDRTILLLYYDQRMRIREIAECVGISSEAVKGRLKRAREKYRETLSY